MLKSHLNQNSFQTKDSIKSARPTAVNVPPQSTLLSETRPWQETLTSMVRSPSLNQSTSMRKKRPLRSHKLLLRRKLSVPPPTCNFLNLVNWTVLTSLYAHQESMEVETATVTVMEISKNEQAMYFKIDYITLTFYFFNNTIKKTFISTLLLYIHW